MEYCIRCDTELQDMDADPNGDQSGKCLRCVAEESHDFDEEPKTRFHRDGRRV